MTSSDYFGSDAEAVRPEEQEYTVLEEPVVSLEAELEPRRRVVHPEGGRLLTKQAMRDETDANYIMEKWIQQGQFPRGPAGSPMYGDFASGLDYHAAVNRVMACEQEFLALPSRVRTACQNDAGEFLRMCSDPERLTELKELGLAEADVPVQVVKVEVVNPTEPGGDSPSDS